MLAALSPKCVLTVCFVLVPTYPPHSVDPFTRKEWYDIKAPATFPNRIAGKTPVNKTQGTSMCVC